MTGLFLWLIISTVGKMFLQFIKNCSTYTS
nr:MAG TPA: hypothetical protein [Caudoviricetes sp.]